MKKSFTKVLLAAAAFFVSPGASAYGIFEADGFYYYITSEADKTVEVTSGENSYVGDVSIPATVEYGGDTYTVTKIGGFSYCSGLTSVDIPDGVVSIGGYAFTGCSSLTSVDIPDGVVSIGDYAFSGCSSLAEINCCATVPPVCGQYCFDYVDISNCTLSVPEGAEEAYKTADVWKEFFYEYFMSGGIKYGALTSSQGNIATVLAGGEYTGDITIPATVENGGITYTVTSIRANAFAECSDLVSVDIPAGVTSIGEAAFNYCSSLTYIDIPAGVTSIGYGTFSGCSSLASIDIPDGVISIGERAFSNCSSLESVTLSRGLETIGYEAFSGCSNLAVVTIPETVTTIETGVFADCNSLASVDIPDKVNSIADYTFYYCSSLESVTLGSGVETIGDCAFSDCSSLAEITCRATVPPVCGERCFDDVDISNCTLSVPEVAEEAYKTADVWKEFFYEYFMSGGIRYGAQTSPQGNIATVVALARGLYTGDITIPETVENGGITYTVTAIGDKAFATCFSLASVDIPDGVVSIGESAFDGCSSLESVTFGSGLETIGESAFNYCRNLKSINIPDGVTSIEFGTFMDCSSLASIDIPDGVTAIGESAFAFCRSLESVTLGSGLEAIGGGAFYGCSGLVSIDIPSGVASIGEDAFGECSSLVSVNIPDGVTSIGLGTFYACSSLASIDIPDGVASIGESAFDGCSSLAEITCRATVPPVCGERCFADVDISNCTLSVPEGTAGDYREGIRSRRAHSCRECRGRDADSRLYRRRSTGIRRYGLRRPNRDSRAGRETLYCKVRQRGVQNGDVAGGT